MTEGAAPTAQAVPRALAEPVAPVRARWVGGLSLAALGMWMAALTPFYFQLPEQMQHLAPRHKFLALGVAQALGAVAAIAATPVIGALSDRTTHGWALGRLSGRRHRWTLAMAVLGGLTLVTMSAQASVAAVIVCWVAFNVFQNGEYASLSAAIPDHVPIRQRATVAGWAGMPQALGLVVGALLVVAAFTGLVSGYIALAVAMVVTVLPFVLATSDPPLAREHRPPLTFRQIITSYRVDLRTYPDFGWAWVTRALASLAISLGTAYLLYFLHDRVHYPHPSAGLLRLILIYTVCVVITAIVGGRISDRLGRRKVIVTASGLLIVLAATVLTFVETWQAAQVAAVFYGTGFGCYLAVDQALITQVLPAARDRAKDLGVINIAIQGPTALGGLLAAVIAANLGYPALFASSGIVAVAGALLVWKIRSVP